MGIRNKTLFDFNHELPTPILEYIKDSVIVTDNDDRVLFLNDYATEQYGIDRKSAIGKQLSELYIYLWINPTDEEKAHKMLSEKGCWYGRNIHIKKNGEKIFVESSVSKLKDDSGNDFGMLAVIRDITEQIKTQDELQKARKNLEKRVSQRTSELEKINNELQHTNELLNNIFSSTYLMIAYLDTDFTFVRVNHAYAEGAGHDPEFFIGKNHFDLFPHEENEAIFRKVVETGKPYIAIEKPFEYPEYPEKGVTYWDWTLSPIKNKEDNIEALLLTLLDRTKKVKGRKALEESERRYRELVTLLPQIVVEFDIDGNVTFVNHIFYELFGYTKEEIDRGFTIFEVLVPEDRDKLQQIITVIQSDLEEKTSDAEFTALKKDGTIIPVLIYTNSIIHGTKVRGFRGFILDISGQKNIEEHLRASEKRLINAQRIAHLGHWDWNIKTNSLFWSDEVYYIFGVSPQKFEPGYEKFLQFVHPDDRAMVEKSVYDALYTNKEYNVIHRIFRPDGEERTVNEQGEVIKSPDGSLVKMIGTVLDITELKRTEKQLFQEQSRLRELVEQKSLLAHIASRLNSSDDVLETLNELSKMISISLGVDNICMWSFNQHNRKNIKLFSYISGFCTRKDYDNPALIQSIKYTLQNEELFVSSNLSGLNPDQKKYFSKRGIHSVAIFPQKSSAINSYICFCQVHTHEWTPDELMVLNTIADMISSALKRQYQIQARLDTEVKLTEAIKVAERTSRLASIGEVAGGITHEINQPLNAIKVTADSILYWYKNNKGIVPEKFISMLQEISGCVDRISDIIRHMKSYWVTPYYGKKMTVDLSTTIKNAFSLVNRQLHAHGINPQLDLYESELIIEGNPIHLEQIVINLINNALYALDKVKRKDKLIKIITFKDGEYAILQVTDNGTGIPEEVRDKIFDPFFSTKEPGEGTGLGLAIVKRFTENHNGTVSVHNNQMGGATFTICFPITSEKKVADNEYFAG